MAAPFLVDPYGNKIRSVLTIPTIYRVLIPGLSKMADRYWRMKKYNDAGEEVECTEGAAVLVRMDAVRRIGMLDEDFFFYGEIVEWCARFRHNGYEVMLVPKAKMVHEGGGSTEIGAKQAIELRRAYYTIIEKILSKWVISTVKARDMLVENLNVLFYAILTTLSCGRWKKGEIKFKCHVGILRWLLIGMPKRSDKRYISYFGSWE